MKFVTDPVFVEIDPNEVCDKLNIYDILQKQRHQYCRHHYSSSSSSSSYVSEPSPSKKRKHHYHILEGWRAVIAVGTNDGPLTSVSNS